MTTTNAPSEPEAINPITCPFTVLIDSREQAPFSFTGFHGDAIDGAEPLIVNLRSATLKTGDYSLSIEGGRQDGRIIIERKSLADLYGSLAASRNRNRFEREHERMADIVAGGGYAAVVIEADWNEILYHPPPHASLAPKTIFRTWIAWSQRHRVPWLAMNNRRMAEITTFRLLDRFYRDLKKTKGE